MKTQITSYETEKLNTNRKISSPGDFLFKSFKIENIDILDKVLSVVIFEDMNLQYVTGEIVCLDTMNIPSFAPLIGGERITFSIRDCFGDTEDFSFILTKVSDRAPNSLGSLTYSIHFVSDVGVLTSMRKVSKAYGNMLTEDIADDIVKNYLVIDNKEPKLNIFQTGNPISCVVPNWRPLHALRWLASRAVSSQTAFAESPYVVFQDRKNEFFYVPLDFLYDESTNVTKEELKFKSGRPTTGVPTLQSDVRMREHIVSFEDFEIVKTTDFIENLVNGMYKNEVTEVDLLARALTSYEYEYGNDFSSSKHLNEFPFIRDGMIGGDEPSHWRTVTSHDGLFSDMKAESSISKNIHRIISKWQQTEQMVIKAVLPGHFGLRIGQKYEIKIPSYKNISRQTDQRNDEYYSGKYIVEKIKHEFAADRHYYTTVQMWSDSVSKKIEVIR